MKPDFNFRLLPNLYSDKSIGDLPGKVYNDLSALLDMGQKWRKLHEVVSENSHYSLRDDQIEECAREVYSGQSASKKLLKLYNLRHMTTIELVMCLDVMRMERALSHFLQPVPLDIVTQPEVEIYVEEGERAVFCCEARGFPYPRYVWFCGDDEVTVTQDCGKLVLERVVSEKSGNYICRVHNEEVLRSKTGPLFSMPCRLVVKPNQYAREQIINEQACTNNSSGSVYGPPLRIMQHPVNSLRVQFHGNITLSCQAYSQSPEPMTYTWLKDGHILNGQGGTCRQQTSYCQIYGATLRDEGKYHCQVAQMGYAVCSADCYITVATGQQSLEPMILRHPYNQEVETNRFASFTVEVEGERPFEYHWYHNGKELRDQYGSQCKLESVTEDHSGEYQVQIANRNGTILSDKAYLNVIPHNVQKYTAEDKVALLLGVSVYRSHHCLPGVEFDILETKRKLEKMEFKVFALMNLTLEEMNVAVEIFCELLDKGVYGLFYFAGHGFVHNRQHYCMPSDVLQGFKLNQCLCTEQVECKAQKGKPALLFMLLDMCRIPEQFILDEYDNPECFQPEVNGNTCLWFATSSGQKAFEIPQEGNSVPRGRFNKQLLKVLDKEKSLFALFEDFRQEFNADHYHDQSQYRQDPEMRCNAKDTKRTLVDTLVYKHNKDAMDKRVTLYKMGHFLHAAKFNLNFGNGCSPCSLIMRPYFSNILDVVTFDNDMEIVLLNVNDEISTVLSPKQMSNGYRFMNLQRLKGNLSLRLRFKYMKMCSTEKVIDLKRPLISNLPNWERFRHRYDSFSSECTENSEDSSMSLSGCIASNGT